MPKGQVSLARALCEVAALGTNQHREHLAALRDRLDGARLRVVVAGEATRGKSTLINALLGRAVLPAGVTPLTTVVTTVRYGEDSRAEVRFLDGHDEKHPLAALADLVTEHGNPGNRRRIASATVYADAPVLAGGAELVDTPGTGSLLERDDTGAARQVLETMDAAVFVLAADPPVSATVRGLLGRVAALSMPTFTVLNKADHLDPPGLAKVVEFTRRVLTERTSRTASGTVRQGDPSPAGSRWNPGRLYPMSASAALQGGDPGFAAFAADFTAFLAARGTADLTRSAIAQARRIAAALLDEVAVARRTARSDATDVPGRVEQFRVRLAGAATSSRGAVTVVNGESARLLLALNDAADADASRLRRLIASQLDALLDGELRAAAPADIERLGRERLLSLTLEAVGAWRQQQQAGIEQGLGRLDARLAADLNVELGVLRDSAAELLGLDLAVPEPDGQLAGIRRFTGTTAETAEQAGLLPPATYRTIPGELGRRRVRQRLRDQIADLVSSQIDKASADLRHQLTEAARTVARVVERRYADAAERVQAALGAAADLRESSTAEARRTEHELAERETALRHALGLLKQAEQEVS